MNGESEDFYRGFRKGDQEGYERGLRKDHDSIFRHGYREGVIAACWTALEGGYFNAKGRKEQIYAELLDPDNLCRPIPFCGRVARGIRIVFGGRK